MLNKLFQLFRKRKESNEQRSIENTRHEMLIQQSEEKAEATRYVHLNGEQIRDRISATTEKYRKQSGHEADKTARELRIMLEAQDLIDEREYRLKRISTIANAPRHEVKKAA
ncbi:hypothetical protein MMG00_12005 [Ignatzschineria rhizosphaerae]|uniref:Uncharacterized protein n=1 Tax=Ignatzschineria rhizosphaerae TaxID=2923279 RepID=A0ABY3WZ63_9GAMM|nr:hypothetical protein [Ignatzschineria rhizosphaerae]UNM95908.1 hypothetical protein MMG00_12005 [Ignatzschineria rhizosphaerae]